MPPLPGFSDNQFRTRNDFIRAAIALVNPLHQYKSSGDARIKIATSTGAGFSETAAQLEGFARPLWVVANLLHLKQQSNKTTSALSEDALESWIDGIRAGTDPKSPEYWGDLSDFDQRMVEMESIAFALLANPIAFSFKNDPTARSNLVAWLRQVNGRRMPQTNWLWFRVLVNLALVKTLHVPIDEVRTHIDTSLETLDKFDIGEGWSSDGLWCEQRRQADYYSGSFAIQFAQLLFVRFAPEYDPARTSKYIEQACEFGKEYWRYFAPNGAAIAFGRSLTYRFAFAAFWAAVALTGLELPAPVHESGMVKGLLSRHLRWWAKQPHIFNTDGTPNIGFVYPNMYLAEDYNSPQSVYWCLKSFLVLGIDEKSTFWKATELLHPNILEAPPTQPDKEIKNVKLLWPPRQILCNTQEHTFLLSSGQSTTKRFKAREAKYGKFAYSASFGFSVPCGPSLEQIAPDSTLAVSLGQEEDEWKVRWDPYDVEAGELYMEVCGETVPTLMSRWKPWKTRNMVIETLLVPPLRKWPGWSLRLHHVKWTPCSSIEETLQIVDGGFAANAQATDNVSIFEHRYAPSPGAKDDQKTVGWWKDDECAFVLSESGASGIVDLTNSCLYLIPPNTPVQSNTVMIRADPNTNLVAQRTVIPAVQHNVSAEKIDGVFAFVTGIFAVDAAAKVNVEDVWGMWRNRPPGDVLRTCGRKWK